MIEDKIIAVLNCAQYLMSQTSMPITIIKQMIYSQLKDCSFMEIEKIAKDEDLDILLIIAEEDENQTRKKSKIEQRSIQRIRESKP
jgi:hypothetical protein